MSVLKFRAGRVHYDESSKIARADPIQGQVIIKPSEEEESFYTFEWIPKDNTPGVEPEELLIVPGDVTLKPLAACTTGRILELKFESSGARNLYWLQEINDDEDKPAELSKKDLAILEKFKSIFEVEEEGEEPATQETAPEPIVPEKPLE